MGFFDKVKNMFTEEVEDEVKVEKIQQEVRHVPIKSPNIEEKNDVIENEIIERFKPVETPKSVFFDDEAFNDLSYAKEEEKIELKEEIKTYDRPSLYKERDKKVKEEKKEEIKFRPTPIISPVYGVLDKNYHKEDIVSKTDVQSSKVDEENDAIDAIRNKAYGTLEDELENTLFGQNSILFRDNDTKEDDTSSDEDLLDDLTDDIGKELDELLSKKNKKIEKKESLKKSEDNEDKKVDVDDDLLGFIDSTLYNKGDEEDDY